tara:strand:- start:196 stop:309 length:114 start_codon:yes stop_codon:yes gene_type:complete
MDIKLYSSDWYACGISIKSSLEAKRIIKTIFVLLNLI